MMNNYKNLKYNLDSQIRIFGKNFMMYVIIQL